MAMTKKATVSLVKCKSYDDNACEAAVRRMFELLGGVASFVKPGQKVFVKPNLLLAAKPDRAITTHPSVMKPIIRLLMDAGAEVSFGDLPGGYHAGNVSLINDKCGMTRLAEETGARLVKLEQFGFRKASIPNGRSCTKYLFRNTSTKWTCS